MSDLIRVDGPRVYFDCPSCKTWHTIMIAPSSIGTPVWARKPSAAPTHYKDRPALGQRKAAQVGPVIGVLAQNQHGEVCAVTDMGRCTWLSQDVTGSGDGASAPDGWSVVTDDGRIEYTAMVDKNIGLPIEQSNDYAWQQCNEMIQEFIEQGIDAASRYVIRPIAFITTPTKEEA